MKVRWWLVLPAVLLALVVAGCGGGDEGGEGGGGAAGQGEASGEPIKIGVSLPLTGDFSEPGKAASQGYQVWERMVNENGGLLERPVEVVIRDDASKQNLVVADYNQLISQERVDLLLGTFSSFLNLPASAVAERNQMLFVCPACGSPEMFNRGFRFLFFSQQAESKRQGDLFAEWLTNLPEDQRPKTAAYVSLDDPFTQPVIAGIQEKLEEAGIETVYDQVYPPDTTNFDTIANSIKSRKADLVAQGSIFNDGVGLIRSFVKAGFSPRTLFQTTAPSLGDQYSAGVGEENTEGVFYAVTWHEELETEGNAEFVERHREMFGGVPAEDAADAFAAAQVLQAAVEEVGDVEDQRAMAAWLHENEVDTVLGTLRWDEKGVPQGEFLIGQWQQGAPEIVLPEDIATADSIVHPKPRWGRR